MLDIQQIRKHPKQIQKNFERRGFKISVEEILKLDREKRMLQTKVQEARHEKSLLSKEVAQRKKQRADAEDLLESIRRIDGTIHSRETALREKAEKLADVLMVLPNLLEDDVPDVSQVLYMSGQQQVYSFTPVSHIELCREHGLIDYETAGSLMGSGYWIYRGLGARLEWALLNFCLEENQKAGYEMLIIPPVAKEICGFGAGQFPKFRDEVYKVQDEDQFLIPTAETVLVNFYLNKMLENKQLPLKYTAFTPCFRREVSKKPDEKGMIRGHHFNKVELVQFVSEEQSEEAFFHVLAQAEHLMRLLGLHYRVVRLAADECSSAMAVTYDLEVWLPAERRYIEVSSVSNARTFQTRRTNTRYKDSGGKIHYVHTLNGSGLATSRLFAAVLEQNQMEDRTIRIPKVLVPWVGTDVLSR